MSKFVNKDEANQEKWCDFGKSMEQMALAIRCFYESRLKEKADEFEKYERENIVDVLTEQIVQKKERFASAKKS